MHMDTDPTGLGPWPCRMRFPWAQTMRGRSEGKERLAIGKVKKTALAGAVEDFM